jgi:hypothetical protein
MEWDEFLTRVGTELKRLGLSERDARFLGFEEPSVELLEELATLPDGMGPEAFYQYLGNDFLLLQKQEKQQEGTLPPDA